MTPSALFIVTETEFNGGGKAPTALTERKSEQIVVDEQLAHKY
jgi:hypothetical protein